MGIVVDWFLSRNSLFGLPALTTSIVDSFEPPLPARLGFLDFGKFRQARPDDFPPPGPFAVIPCRSVRVEIVDKLLFRGACTSTQISICAPDCWNPLRPGCRGGQIQFQNRLFDVLSEPVVGVERELLRLFGIREKCEITRYLLRGPIRTVRGPISRRRRFGVGTASPSSRASVRSYSSRTLSNTSSKLLPGFFSPLSRL